MLAFIFLFVPWISSSPIQCDIFIAGGSTASFSAALSAARLKRNSSVCLTDPTDWIGGQLTSSAVSAIDFGEYNNPDIHPGNLPASFMELCDLFSSKTGMCWVSSRCYQPTVLNSWIENFLAKLPNLRVYPNTVITEVSSSNGRIRSMTAVQRTPRPGSTGWELRTSEMILDWYSNSNSSLFTKQELHFQSNTFIEATEFGDVLNALSWYAQGIEQPYEYSDSYFASCGQSFTVDFYEESSSSSCSYDPPLGAPRDFPEYHNLSAFKVWTYRRVKSEGVESLKEGQMTLQNFQPMDSEGFLFEENGNLNISALSAAEMRSFGYYHYFNKWSGWNSCMNRSETGTLPGLAKMPYLRDTKRSRRGVGGFRLLKSMLADAIRFSDTVGIGFYPVDHHIAPSCPHQLPSYISNSSITPFYIPYRALTVEAFSNLLVAGKSMSMSWLANSCMREHPQEWTTGEAAGITAALFAGPSFDSRNISISLLQKTLLQIDHPLEWKL